VVSRAKGQVRIPEQRPARVSEVPGGPINPKTGELQFTPTGKRNRKGELVEVRTTQMAITKDARTLSSGTKMEAIYADHANKMKALANQARREMVNVKGLPPSSSAAKATYAKEVASLDAKVAASRANAPLERQAQRLANARAQAVKTANPSMTPSQMRKVQAQSLSTTRARVGATTAKIEINWDEWNAMQAGAVSPSKQKEILSKANLTEVRKMATPKTAPLMTPTAVSRAHDMQARGYTLDEIAEQLGVGRTTLVTALKK
jgi:hypothetical protein